MFCNRCGHRNPERSNFCSSCGAPLERGGAEIERTTTAIPAVALVPGEAGPEPLAFDAGDLLHGVPEGGAVLVVTRGPNEGSRFVLGAQEPGVVTIGRHPESDIFLDDITVSRRHAEVRRSEGRFWATDVGSLNGTYLNRQSIETAALSSGDELQVGKFRLLFLAPLVASGASASQPAARPGA
ncbi:MAG TPA: FHA domain-containing protein [Acidimicrobiales bacterium]|nr:FHA domain-containing protein [Acidimicrobiales bacterium]